MFKNRNNTDNKCQYTDINECPYNSRKECPQLKPDCHMPNDSDFEAGMSKKRSWVPIILVVSSAIILVVLEFNSPKSDNWLSVFNLLSAGCISVIAGVLLSWLVDVPRKFDDYSRLISTSLTSYTYLRGLSRKELAELRERVTAELYMKDTPKMPRGLIKLDNRICELLSNPYYLVYRETIDCEKPDTFKNITGKDLKDNKDGQLFLKKNNNQVYTIKNPFSGVQPIKANIGLNNYVFLPNECPLNDLFIINKYLVSIDNSKFVDIIPLLKVTYQKREKTDVHSPETTTYNTGFQLITKTGSSISQESLLSMPFDNSKAEYEESSVFAHDSQLVVTFSVNVRVQLSYSLIVPVADNHYTKRLKYSTKSYRLDYSIADTEQRLTGQLLGTLIDQSQIEINESDDERHLSIEAFEWLLPKSGATVVYSKK